MTEKPVPLSVGRNADDAFEPSQVEVEEDAASSNDDQLLKRFRHLVDENKEEIFRMHQLQGNEYFRENLEEPKEEEMPQIIELDQDGFYKGDLISDYSNQVVGRSEKLKNLIDMQRFFEPYPDRRAKSVPKRGLRVTLTGSAGSGKTTILSRFAREATKGMIDQMKQEDHLVHQINCRELERHKKISVAEFLFKTMLCGLSKEQMEAGCQWMQKNPQKVTLIIDSLDTMGYSLQKVEQDSGSGVTTPDVILHGILTGKLFREAFVLTSSREYEIRDYKGDLCADKVLSLGGFKKESIKRLSIGFLGQEEGEKVVKKLEAYPRLMELCKTPVFLIFTIIGLKDTGDSSAFVPKSMAGVLVKLINCLSGSMHAHTRERYSDEECIEAINKMKGLAYNGTMEDKVLYTEEDLQNALLTKDEVIDLVLIIPGKVEKAQQILEKGSVSFFIHQTVAELFCALKICEKDLDGFRSFVTKELPKLRFLVIRRLVCGILQDSEVYCEASNILLRGVSDVEEKRQILRDILSEEFRESTKKGNRQGILELLHVIHESGDRGKGILPTEIEKIFLGSIALVPSDTFALAGAIHNSSLLETLNLCKCELTPETIQALDNKLEDSALKMKELNVSWNEHLGVEGYSSLGRLGRRHEVHKLGIDFCEPNAKELDALDEGLGDATVEELDASLNIKMGTNGFASMGSLMKKHGVDKLEIRRCELKSEEVDAFDGGLGDAKVEELDVSHNENLGVKGFFSIGRFIRRHDTNKLGLVRCKLKSEEVDSFDEGLEDAKLEKLDVSLNKNLGVKGLTSMGRLVGKHGVDDLEMRGCELKSEEVECFVEGLGDAQVKKIALSRQRLPLPMSAICKLLPKVTECLDLRWNMLGEGDRSYLQEKLNQLPQTNLKVEIAMIKDEVKAAISEESSQDFGDCIVTVKRFSAKVETSSKEVWVNDCVINFQEGCFNDTTTVNGSLVIDKSKWPPGYFLITPIIHLTADTELVKPVAIKASSWGVKDQDDVSVDVLRLPSGSSTWEIVEKQPLTCNKCFRFDCSDFSPVAVGLPVELLDSVLFNIDVCLYATKADNFSTTFSLGDEEVLTKMKENMAQSNFELKYLFNIKAKNDDKLKCCLSTVKHIDFSLIPDANFLVTVDEHLLTMHTNKITTSQLDSDRFPGEPRRAVLRFEIYRNGKIAGHPFGFSHDYRSAAAIATAQRTAIASGDNVMSISSFSLRLEDFAQDPSLVKKTHVQFVPTASQDLEIYQEDIDSAATYRPLSESFSQHIGSDGGKITIGGCSITFPSGAFLSRTKVEGKVEIDRRKWPENYRGITPMLYVDTEGDLELLATVEMTTWCVVHNPSEDGSHAMAHALHYSEESSTWETIEMLPITNKATFQFQCLQFSPVIVATKNDSDSQRFLVDGSLYTSDKNSFYVAFHLKSEMLQRSMEQEMEKRKLSKEVEYDQVEAELLDTLQVVLSCNRPSGFSFPPSNPLRFSLKQGFEKKQLSTVLRKEQSAVVDQFLEIQTHIEKNGEIIDGPHFFCYEWKFFQPPTVSTVPEAAWANAQATNIPTTNSSSASVSRVPASPPGMTQTNVQHATSDVGNNEGSESTETAYRDHLTKDNIYHIGQEGRIKGRALIINNEFRGKEGKERDGSEADMRNMARLWHFLGFEVAPKINLCAEDMLRSCADFANESKNVCALVVIIMSHGGENAEGKEFFHGEDEVEVLLEDVISNFTVGKCGHLASVPKVFMLQACRGDIDDTRRDAASEEIPQPKARRTTRLPMEADMLLTYPTKRGCTALRNRVNGSWLMNAITNVFMEHAHDTHILDMLTMVNREVSNRVVPGTGQIEVSNQENYLTKRLYFFPGWPK